MKQVLPLLTLGVAVAALCGATAPALAEDDVAPLSGVTDVIAAPQAALAIEGDGAYVLPPRDFEFAVEAPVASSAPPDAVDLLFANAVEDDGVLSANRGGADVHLSDMRAVGSVSDVDASDLLTGHNIITEGGLANANGMPMVIQNSGNGVLIQNAVIVNLDMTQ